MTRDTMDCPFCEGKLVFVRVTNGDWGICCPECCFALPTFRTEKEAGDKSFPICDQIAARLAKRDVEFKDAMVALLDGKTIDAKVLCHKPVEFVELTFSLAKDGE